MKHLLFACLCAASIFSFSSCDEKKSTEPANYVEFVTVSPTVTGSVSSGEIVVANEVRNISGRQQEFQWEISNISTPGNSWNAPAICDIVQCWASSVTTKTFTLPKDAVGRMDLHFYMGTLANTGNGTATIRVWPTNDVSKAVTTTFTAVGNR